MASKIAEMSLTPNSCGIVRVPELNEAVAQNRKILPYDKRVDIKLSEIKQIYKSSNFNNSANCKSEFEMPERI